MTEKKKRKLSNREIVLVVALVVIVVVLGWYRLFYLGVADRIAIAEQNQGDAEDQIMTEQITNASLTSMQAELDRIDMGEADIVPVAEYDNYLNVLAELRGKLEGRQYAGISGLEAGEMDENGIYRRSVTISDIVCDDYDDARAFVDLLADSEYRCMLKCVSITAVTPNNEDATLTSAQTAAAEPEPEEEAETETETESAEETETETEIETEEPEPEPEEESYTLLTVTVTFYEKEN